MIKLQHKETLEVFNCYNINNDYCLFFIDDDKHWVIEYDNIIWNNICPYREITLGYPEDKIDTTSPSYYYYNNKNYQKSITTIPKDSWITCYLHFFKPYIEE